jgi:hypothetical protein
MKRALMLIATIVIASTSVSGENLDSLVLARMYGFRQSLGDSLQPFTTNVYMKHLYQTHRRNFTLWTVPSLYTIADGKRAFVSEQYGKLSFDENSECQYKRQAYYSTIPGQRNTMPVLQEYFTPNIYDVALYEDHILSPFNRENKRFYRYRMEKQADSTATVYFRPRLVSNTQLVKGRAKVDICTGRVDSVVMEGEYDMIHFRTLYNLGKEGARALMPRHSQTNVVFKFLGNHVSSYFEAVFDCPTILHDTIDVKGDRALIDSLRPIPLTDEERFVYATYDYKNNTNVNTEEEQDTTKINEGEEKRRHNYLKEIFWDVIGENLVRTLRADNDNGYVKLSPILNPQYISYSGSKGFSYKLKMGAQYNFTPTTWVETSPYIGYNFKLREFYWSVPVYLFYWNSMKGLLELSWGSDNRIGNNVVLEEIRKEYGDRPELEDKNLDLFDDKYFRLNNSISPTKWLTLETGLVSHHRHALNAEEMRAFGKPTQFNSLAPSIGVKLMPWKRGPMFSIDYERGLKVGNVDMAYERWEGDLSIKHAMKHLQTLNIRLGGGLYTTRGNNYFMDYSNFRDCNLPLGWDDDWTGNFQLLSSDLYNASDFYLRGNISYESPLLMVSMVPLLGRYIERERVYLSTLSIANTRLYSEVGYSFTCRYASVAFFASFFSTHYQEFGSKFTFELFRRW